MENKQRGGKRLRAGRKPVSDKKKPITIYAAESKINSNGGKEVIMERLTEVLNNDFLNVQDLNQPTHQIKPITAPLPQSNVVVQTQPQNAQISQYNEFREQLKKCSTITEIEKVMSGVKSALMLPREKITLESFAKELSKDMYND